MVNSRFWRAAVGVVVLCVCTFAARGEDVWRMAGTFNAWNTRDDAWALLPVNGNTGVFALERTIDPGSFAFKFVKNGDWAQGHLGQSGSLVNEGDDVSLEITCADQAVKIDPTNKGPLTKFVTPSKAGKATLHLTLRAGDKSATADVPVVFEHEYKLIMKADEPAAVTFPSMAPNMQPQGGVKEGFLVLEPQGEGVCRAVLKVEKPSTFTTLAVTQDSKESLISNQNVTIAKPGLYAVEVRDGQVVTQTDTTKPFLLIPGAWRQFEFKPPEGVSAGSATLTGDFNRWAMPGNTGAIPLASRLDGTFAAWVNIPDGAHRYRVVLDGDRQVLDPNASTTSTGPDGQSCSVMILGKTPADFPAAKPESINTDAVSHDPASSEDVRTIEMDTGLAELSVRTLPGDVEAVLLHIDLPDGAGKTTAQQIPMVRSSDLAGFDRWTARVMTGSKDLVYSFGLIDGKTEYVTRDFKSTLIPDSRLDLPAWAMGATWYQIFPERFRNGNPLNDPHGKGVFLMKWNADWYKPGKGEAEAWMKAWMQPGEHMPSRTGGEIYNYIWDRRYGGDLQGIVEKLDELKNLGITAIYLNPIFEAASMHKYDATDYRHIDDNFAWPRSAGQVDELPWKVIESETEDPSTWTWTPADRYFVDEFLPACKRAGMHVIVDGVFNHTGREFFAFADIEKNGDKSRYKDWYYVEFDDEGKLKSWVSWFNTGALPKFKQKPNGDLIEPVKQHLFNITKRWMDPNGDGDPSDGIDGWRLDVALDVGLPFWKDWRAHVKKINPDAIIVAEIWDDASNVLTGDAFDTQMNYPFAIPVTEWLAVKPGMTSEELGQRLNAAFGESPQTCLIHQNLFCSHDTDRFVSMLDNPGRGYDQRNRIQDQDGQSYKQTQPAKNIYDLSLVGLAIQATYLGAPMVYYGDEYGMWGADDPTCRKPVPWPDKGRNENKDDEPIQFVRKAYVEWLNLRKDPVIGPILRYGTVRHLATAEPGVFAFTRELNGKRVVVVANREKKAFDAAPLLPKGTRKTKVGPVSAEYWLID